MEIKQRRGVGARKNNGFNYSDIQAIGPSLSSSFGIGSSPIIFQQTNNALGSIAGDMNPNLNTTITDRTSEPRPSSSRKGRGPPLASILDSQSPFPESSSVRTQPQVPIPTTSQDMAERRSVIFADTKGTKSRSNKPFDDSTGKSTNSFIEPKIIGRDLMYRDSMAEMSGPKENRQSKDPYELQTFLYTWIVISGFNNTAKNVNDLLYRFQNYGDIIDYEIGKGNWLFVRFATAMQAEQAISSENNQLFQYGTLLSVFRMTESLSEKLEFQRNKSVSDSLQDDNHQVKVPTGYYDESTPMTRAGELGMAYRSHLAATNSGTGFEQYLQPPKSKRSNICKRLMEFFFSY